jgi:Outer membrane protein beta-barrel domain
MKKIFFLLFSAIACTAHGQNSFSENGAVKAGVGYVHDFTGLNGMGAFAEYSFPLNGWLQGGAGFKRMQTNGYPQTQTVKEYTKATTLDFNLLFVPLHTDNIALRIGAGYSFSFYNTRRSYAVDNVNTSKAPDWKVQDDKGRVTGITVMGEYEYYFANNISLGARVTVAKAYMYVVMAGPFVSMRF